ncbi:unnamed protein product [Polarella glacialis]|uniref:Uncharacterized protein n=1 Tax=Polarella glacialis TaxID=89957 RepID=A0A813HC85_POLGL|nr:unnamed protein product [Polarella glacialis]
MASSSSDLYSRARGSVRTAAEREAAEREAGERDAVHARVLASIDANDFLAYQLTGQLSKKQRQLDKAVRHMSRKAMVSVDRESLIQNAFDLADARAVSAESSAVSVPEPKFSAGQSVLQWWAP